jgi:hypothetical protein
MKKGLAFDGQARKNRPPTAISEISMISYLSHLWKKRFLIQISTQPLLRWVFDPGRRTRGNWRNDISFPTHPST